jgi:hypothetical protein
VRVNARLLLGSIGLSVLGLSGCAGTYDMLTSQRFRERPFETMFTREEPLVVLEKSNAEGDERVRAMRRLDEPSKNSRSAQEQDRAMAILNATATTDSSSLCRLAAVEALSRFEDPRAVTILMTAYQNAPHENPAAPLSPVQQVALGAKGGASSFTPETVKMLQCQVLDALGKHHHPEALKLLCDVAAMPTQLPKPTLEQTGGFPSTDFNVTGLPESDRNDVRLAAIRALGNYEGQSLAIKTLVSIMQTESDVAIRGRAHDSLVSITGQDLEADGAVWAKWLAEDGKPRKAGLFR